MTVPDLFVAGRPRNGTKLAEGEFSFPADYALQKVAILATTGAGKSNTAAVIAEELWERSIPWVVIDPKGDWWGITAKGPEHAGIPVPVFGGEHGNVPLEPTAGKLIARLVAEQRLSCVIDVSDFDSRGQMFRFLTDFASTLLRLNRQALHIFAEECDDYLPQRTAGEGGDLAKCLGAWQRLIKRGRQRGIGATLISQRAASVNKDALNMAQTVIAMRVTAPRDITAVREWVLGPGARVSDMTEEDAEMLASLPKLDHGEAWVYSPQWLGIRRKVQFRRRSTFDSGATPDLMSPDLLDASPRAEVDIDALGAEIAATVERQRQDDPEELRRQLAQLRRELAEAAACLAEPGEAPEPVVIAHVPPALIEAADAIQQATADVLGDLRRALDLEESTGRIGQARRGLDQAAKDALAQEGPLVTVHISAPAPVHKPFPIPPTAATTPPISRPPVSRTMSSEESSLSGAPARILAALAAFPEGLTKRQIAAHASIVQKTSTMRNALSNLRVAGLISGSGDRIVITEAGMAQAGGIAPLPSGPELLDYWRQKLGTEGSAPRRAFEALLACWPNELERHVIGERAGIDPTTSTLRNALSDLRRFDLIDVDQGCYSVSRTLMEAAR